MRVDCPDVGAIPRLPIPIRDFSELFGPVSTTSGPVRVTITCPWRLGRRRETENDMQLFHVRTAHPPIHASFPWIGTCANLEPTWRAPRIAAPVIAQAGRDPVTNPSNSLPLTSTPPGPRGKVNPSLRAVGSSRICQQDGAVQAAPNRGTMREHGSRRSILCRRPAPRVPFHFRQFALTAAIPQQNPHFRQTAQPAQARAGTRHMNSPQV